MIGMAAFPAFQLPPQDPDGRYFRISVLEQLEQFRKRLVRSAVAILVGMLVAFTFIERIVDVRPLTGAVDAARWQPADLHRADRSVLALHRHRAARGCRSGVAVRPLSVLAAHRAGALLAPEEVRDPVRRAHERRRRRRRGVQPLHRVPLHDRVLRHLQLHRRRVPAAGRGHVRSVREDAARE